MGGFTKVLQEIFPAPRPSVAEDATEGVLRAAEAPSGGVAPGAVEPPAPGAVPETPPPVAPPSPKLNVAGATREIEGADLNKLATDNFGGAGAPADPILKEKMGIDPIMAPREPEGKLFNPARIDAPDDINTLFDEVADRFPQQFQEYTRGVQTLDKIEERALAGMWDLSVDDVLAMRSLKGEDFTKASFAMMNMAHEIKRVALKVQSPDGSEIDTATLRLLMEDFVAVTKHTKGLQTETARTLSAMRIMKKEVAASTALVSEVVAGYGGQGVNKRLAAMIASLDPSTPQGMAEMGKMITKSHKATGWDMMWEAYYASLLSSIPTHVVNGGTGILAYGWRHAELPAAYMVGRIRRMITSGPQGLYWKELQAFRADSATIMSGLQRGWRAAKSNEPTDLATKLEGSSRKKAITASNVRGIIDENVVTSFMTTILPDLLKDGHWTARGFDLLAAGTVQVPSRVMMTMDETIKGFAMHSGLNQAATRVATEEGLSGPAFANRVTELLQDPVKLMPEQYQEAVDFAREVTFQDLLTKSGTKPGDAPQETAGSFFSKWIFNTPTLEAPAGAGRVRQTAAATGEFAAKTAQALLLRAQLPFIKTVVNLAKWSLHRGYVPAGGIPIPTAMLLPSFWGEIAKGGRHSDLAIAKMGMGVGLTYSMFETLSLGEILTGSGPLDKRAAREWKSLGHQPYSIVIDKDSMAGKMVGLDKSMSISIKRGDPFSLVLGLQADIADVWGYSTDQERDLFATALAASMYRNLHDRTFMDSMSKFMDGIGALESGNTAPITKLFAKTVASPVIPSGVAWTGRLLDDDERLARDTNSEQSALDRGQRGPDREFHEIQSFVQAMVNKIKARSPGLGNDLPVLTDFWNKPWKGPRGFMFDIFPFYQKDLGYNPSELEALGIPPVRFGGIPAGKMGMATFQKFLNIVGPEGEFVRLGTAPAQHGRSILGIPLTPHEHADYVKIVNEMRAEEGSWLEVDGVPFLDHSNMTMRETIIAAQKTVEYFQAPDDPEMPNSKPRIINKIVSDYRHDQGRTIINLEEILANSGMPDALLGLGGTDMQMYLTNPALRRRLTDATMAMSTPGPLQ
jgi:hypothetical protein